MLICLLPCARTVSGAARLIYLYPAHGGRLGYKKARWNGTRTPALALAQPKPRAAENETGRNLPAHRVPLPNTTTPSHPDGQSKLLLPPPPTPSPVLHRQTNQPPARHQTLARLSLAAPRHGCRSLPSSHHLNNTPVSRAAQAISCQPPGSDHLTGLALVAAAKGNQGGRTTRLQAFVQEPSTRCCSC
jgi:hypothetical protein